MDTSRLRKELIDDEGLRLRAYTDSLGLLTIGVGRLIDPRRPGGLSVDECMGLLNNDIARTVKALEALPWWSVLSDSQQRGLVNMAFQLGVSGLLEFSTFIDLMAHGRYKEAGEDLKTTKWYREVPARANRVIKLLTSPESQQRA